MYHHKQYKLAVLDSQVLSDKVSEEWEILEQEAKCREKKTYTAKLVLAIQFPVLHLKLHVIGMFFIVSATHNCRVLY